MFDMVISVRFFQIYVYHDSIECNSAVAIVMDSSTQRSFKYVMEFVIRVSRLTPLHAIITNKGKVSTTLQLCAALSF